MESHLLRPKDFTYNVFCLLSYVMIVSHQIETAMTNILATAISMAAPSKTT